jgi:branched-chain amino acid transport system substrate-binding protein
VQEANARHAVKGWTIDVRALDDSSDPAKGKQDAAQFVVDRKVAAVIGPYNSGVALEAAPVLARGNLALVSPSNTLTSLTVGTNPANPQRQWKTYFRLVGPDSAQARFLAEQASKLGYKNVAVVSETKAVSKGLADEFASAFQQGGGKIAVQQVVPDAAAAGDFASFVTAANAAHPDLVFFGGEYNVAATLRTTATAAGLTVPIMGGDGMNDPAYITGAGAAAQGTLASTVGTPVDQLAQGPSYLAAYHAAGFTTSPSSYGPYAYDAANAVIAALAKTLKGRTSLPAGLRKQMVGAIQATSRTGITGHLAFNKYGDVVDPSFTLYRVVGTPLAWTPVP